MNGFIEYNKQNEALLQKAQSGEDIFLGNLVWYSVSGESLIGANDFSNLVAENVPYLEDFVPATPKPRDVFKRSCKIDIPRQASDHETFYNYMTRDAGYDSTNVWRMLVREEVDAKDHKLGYSEVGKMVYTAIDESHEITYLDLTSGADPMVAAVLATMGAEFTKLTGKLHHYPLREFIRKSLEYKLHSVRVRPGGGVYFVDNDHYDKVVGIANVFEKVNGAEVHFLPLLNDVKQRDMLRRAFEEETLDEMLNLLNEVNTSKGTDKNLAEHAVRFSYLKDKASRYLDLLESSSTKLEAVREALSIALKKSALSSVTTGDN